jgi:hypothetical protein
MDEKKILEILCEYFNAAGIVTVMPEVWREGCGAIFVDDASVKKRFVDGSMEIFVKFDIAMRADGCAAGDRLDVFEKFAAFCEYAVKHPVQGSGKIYFIGGPKLFGIYSDGAEYRCAYEIRYVRGGE